MSKEVISDVITADANVSGESVSLKHKMPVSEKIAYALGDVGCNFIWGIASTFLMLYYTNSAKLDPVWVGTMMLVARVLDAFSDIAMGVVIEKTNTRWGKVRPWIFIGSIPFAISLVLLLNVPADFSDSAKQMYAAATYIFMAVICYTMVNLAYHSMLPRLSTDQQDRSVASTVRSFGVMIVAVGMNFVTPAVLKAFGGFESQQAWTRISVVYAVIALICLLACFFGTKEKIIQQSVEETKVNKVPLKDSLKAVATTKYFFIIIGLFIAQYITTGTGGVGIYYFSYAIGNSALFGLNTLVVVAATLVSTLLIPTMFKRFTKRKTIMAGFIMASVASVIGLLAPLNPVVYLGVNVFRAFGLAPFTVTMFTLAADLVDYGEWKKGVRAEGFAYGSTSFGMKLGTGLGTAILGWILGWGGFNAAATVQSEGAIRAMIICALAIPLAIYIIELILMYFWDIDKIFPQIQKDLDEKRNREQQNLEAEQTK